MADIRWTGGAGDCSTSFDWRANAVPELSDKAVISVAGSYTATVSASETERSILLNS
jgi:hypothetical protein